MTSDTEKTLNREPGKLNELRKNDGWYAERFVKATRGKHYEKTALNLWAAALDFAAEADHWKARCIAAENNLARLRREADTFAERAGRDYQGNSDD